MKRNDLKNGGRMWLTLTSLLVAAILIAGGSVGNAWSYFTTYAAARGGHQIHLGDETEISEEFDSWTKHVSISNETGSTPVFVRVKAFTREDYQPNIKYYPAEEGTWRDGGDGYWYCNTPLEGGENTPVIDIKLENAPKVDDPAAQGFNIVVIYEKTPALYANEAKAQELGISAGDPYPDWNNVEGGDKS
jgi:hypothetical protein